MPSPHPAVMLAKLLIVTLPKTFAFGVLLAPPLYPARMPAGCEPSGFSCGPELMAPLAVTIIVLASASGIDVAWLKALIPAPWEVTISPDEVVTEIFPLPFEPAQIPLARPAMATFEFADTNT